jgi:L-ascorbate metabolism protein UlaG (beta-lactamase superfamily)
MIEPVQKDEKLVNDFHAAETAAGAIHVWWLGQSGFLVKWNGQSILIDPYLSNSYTRPSEGTEFPIKRASERVVDPLALTSIETVVCSSAQPDRLDPETLLPLTAANPNLKLVVPAGIEEQTRNLLGKASPNIVPVNAGTFVTVDSFEFHGIDAATPKIRRDVHSNSKDLGFVILFGPFALYHSGQTIWHTHLVKAIRRWPINLSFMPINGDEKAANGRDSLNGFEAAALAKAIGSSLVVPAHYDMFDLGNVTTDEFSSCCERLSQRYRLLKLGQRMTMGPVTDPSSGRGIESEPYREEKGLGY